MKTIDDVQRYIDACRRLGQPCDEIRLPENDWRTICEEVRGYSPRSVGRLMSLSLFGVPVVPIERPMTVPDSIVAGQKGYLP